MRRHWWLHLADLARPATLALLLVGTLGAVAAAQDEDMSDRADQEKPQRRAVTTVADGRLEFSGVALPLYVSADWSAPMPNITRVVIVVHGVGRNADSYFASARRAQAAAGDIGRGTLVIAPQFLTEEDVTAHQLPANTLHWRGGRWEAGEPARGPRPLSSFDAIDAIVARLADRNRFPRLAVVVFAGHSGGAQFVQRYAIATRGEAALLRVRIQTRYVVANPSSYAYFSPDRPVPTIAASCPRFNDWKYGLNKQPPYLGNRAPSELERGYVARRVIYLLGTADIDPNHPQLDKACMAEAQGPMRYVRGHAFVDYMRRRDQGTPNHVVWDVPGVGHSGGKMLTSPCGVAALFDQPGCVAAAANAPPPIR